MRKIRAAILVTVAAAFPALAFAGSNCEEPKTGTKAIPIFSPPLSEPSGTTFQVRPLAVVMRTSR